MGAETAPPGPPPPSDAAAAAAAAAPGYPPAATAQAGYPPPAAAGPPPGAYSGAQPPPPGAYSGPPPAAAPPGAYPPPAAAPPGPPPGAVMVTVLRGRCGDNWHMVAAELRYALAHFAAPMHCTATWYRPFCSLRRRASDHPVPGSHPWGSHPHASGMCRAVEGLLQVGVLRSQHPTSSLPCLKAASACHPMRRRRRSLAKYCSAISSTSLRPAAACATVCRQRDWSQVGAALGVFSTSSEQSSSAGRLPASRSTVPAPEAAVE